MRNARPRSVRCWRWAVLACSVVAFTLTQPAPATAAVTLTYHSSQRTVGTGIGAEKRTACPSGSHVVAGGVDINGGNGFSWLLASYPYDGGDSDTIPDDGWAGAIANDTGVTRTLKTFAVCTTAGTFKYVKTAPYVIDPGHTTYTWATCPSGFLAVGGGNTVTRMTARPITISGTGPFAYGNFANNAWQLTVTVRPSENEPATVRSVAVCAKGLSPTYVQSSPAIPQSSATVRTPLACPAGHKGVTQGGAEIDGSGFFHSAYPYDGGDGDTLPDDGLTLGINSGNGPSTLKAVLICLV